MHKKLLNKNKIEYKPIRKFDVSLISRDNYYFNVVYLYANDIISDDWIEDLIYKELKLKNYKDFVVISITEIST